MRPFVVVVAVATIVAGIAIYGSTKAREAAGRAQAVGHENRILIHKLDDQAVKIGQLQREQRASCNNYETLRAAVNAFHGTIKSFLTTAERARASSAETAPSALERRMNLRAARIYKKLIANTHQVTATCAQKRE